MTSPDELSNLVERLKSKDLDEVREALGLLWRKGWIPRAADILTEELQRERDDRRLYASIEALGELGPAAKDAVPAMVALWEHPNPDLYLASRDIIADMGIAAIPGLRVCVKATANDETQQLILALMGRCQKTGHTERAFQKYLSNMPLSAQGSVGGKS